MNVTRPDSLEHCTDAQLVRLLLAGNHDAMIVIFDRYYRLAMSIALRMLHDVGEAEDVVQVVFTEFYQKANLFDESKGNLGTWLVQYVYGRTLNHKRDLKVRHYYDQLKLDEVKLHNLGTTSSSVLRLETCDAVRLVEQILPSLNEKQRFVIERVFFEGMRVSEIASETGDSLGNIHHAYYRGIEKLREYLLETANEASSKMNGRGKRFFARGKSRKPSGALTEEVQIAKTRTL